jgi:hypothetical protein
MGRDWRPPTPPAISLDEYSSEIQASHKESAKSIRRAGGTLFP